jgi:heme O synthase-like polyprenyltransferase
MTTETAELCTPAHPPAHAPRTPRDLLRDLMTLTKPGVTRMCALTAAGAAWMALRSPHSPFAARDPRRRLVLAGLRGRLRRA